MELDATSRDILTTNMTVTWVQYVPYKQRHRGRSISEGNRWFSNNLELLDKVRLLKKYFYVYFDEL